PIKHALIGQRSGKRFRLGDSTKIQVARVDLDKCEIDFVLAEALRTQRAGKGKLAPAANNKKQKRSRKKKKY
ncbi:MAG: hypothetical protein JO149_07655, partial [Gammaproteobacteria bacterium]|nr:hypothetical protein [Gammaproteobacteria bacterium]